MVATADNHRIGINVAVVILIIGRIEFNFQIIIPKRVGGADLIGLLRGFVFQLSQRGFQLRCHLAFAEHFGKAML